MDSRYSILLMWSDETHAYLASIPELPEVRAAGNTMTEALQAVQAQLDAYVQSQRATGQNLPEARALSQYSGQFRLRLPRTLHASLVQEADAEGVSLNSYIQYLITYRHVQQTAVRKIAGFGNQIRQTIRNMHDLVSNMTVTNASPSVNGIVWRNTSSITITQVQSVKKELPK